MSAPVMVEVRAELAMLRAQWQGELADPGTAPEARSFASFCLDVSGEVEAHPEGSPEWADAAQRLTLLLMRPQGTA